MAARQLDHRHRVLTPLTLTTTFYIYIHMLLLGGRGSACAIAAQHEYHIRGRIGDDEGGLEEDRAMQSLSLTYFAPAQLN